MGGSQRGRNIGSTGNRFPRQGSPRPVRDGHGDVAAPLVRPAPRRWPVVASAVLIIIVVGAGAVALLRHIPGQTAPQGPYPIVQTFAHGAIACPAAATWSPDSRRVAVAGFSTCPPDAVLPASGPLGSATLTLFDAGTGQPLKTTQLSAEITAKALPATVRNDSTALGQAQVLFGAMQWSAHTHELMLEVTTFQADLTGSGQASVLNTALVLIPDGGDLRVISAPGDSQSGATSSSITTSFAPLPVTRWDVSAGTASATTVPQALAYTWTANDSLAATLTLPSTPDTAPPAVQITPIGNPAGDTTFSTWQSGSIGFGSSCGDSNGGGVCCTNITYLTATFGGPTAWSPDGRYILTPPIGGTAIGAVGELAAPPVDTANIPGACSGAQTSVQYVRLPARDAGLTNSLRAFDLSRVGLVVAWSPDGQRIAVRADHSLSGSAHELSIFDCRTGKLLGSYSADQVQHGLPSDRGSTAQFGIGLPPIWSPDGTHLLILDNDLRVLSILGHDMIEH